MTIETARDRLPVTRSSVTKVFRLVDEGGAIIQFYFTAGMYDDGRPGEVFIVADRGGTNMRGTYDAIGVLISLLLQYGIPLEAITSKLKNTRFPPASYTKDADVPNCSSPLDLLARWLELKFPTKGS